MRAPVVRLLVFLALVAGVDLLAPALAALPYDVGDVESLFDGVFPAELAPEAEKAGRRAATGLALLGLVTALGCGALAGWCALRIHANAGVAPLALLLAFLPLPLVAMARAFALPWVPATDPIAPWSHPFALGTPLVIAGALLLFGASFPDQPNGAGRASDSTLRRATLHPATPWLLVATGLIVPALWSPRGGAGVVLTVAAMVVATVATLYGLANLRRGLRQATGEGRRQARWISMGLVLPAYGAVVAAVLVGLGVVGVVLWSEGLPGRFLSHALLPGFLTLLGIPLLMAGVLSVAVLYRGALAPELALRRTTVVGAAGVVGVFAFAGLEEVLTDVVASRFGLPGRTGSILAAGLLALAFAALRRPVSRLARRLPVKDFVGVETPETSDGGHPAA